MNLQESIKKVLKEENRIPLQIKRRIGIAEDYVENLNPDDVCRYWKDDDVNNYVREGMAEITRFIIDSILGINDDDYIEMYDDVYGILIDLGYRERMENFFYESLENCNPKDRKRFIEPNLQEHIRKVLKEENKKLPSFFTRRIDHHKFEKMMRKGIPYIFYDSNSLEEFKYKLVEATLENYIHYKYDINIDELPQEDKDTFIKHMIEVYDPVLTAYYRNFKNR